jgi:RNA polymerase sigma-54 factor
MVPGLQLSQRLTQSLVLAPQLQQSLALLQAPTLELKALVEQELQQNPVLEEINDTDMEAREGQSVNEDGDVAKPDSDLSEPPEDVAFDTASDKQSSEPVDDFQAEFEKLFPRRICPSGPPRRMRKNGSSCLIH